MKKQLIALQDIAAIKASGLPFETVHQLYWVFRQRKENGFAEAFIKIGRRTYLDPVKFHELSRSVRYPSPKPPAFPPATEASKRLPKDAAILRALRFHHTQIGELIDSLEHINVTDV